MIYKGINFVLFKDITVGSVYVNTEVNGTRANIWKAERFLIFVDCFRTQGISTVNVAGVNYTLNSQRRAVIDMTDFVRAYTGNIRVEVPYSSAVYATIIYRDVQGLINPKKQIIPPHDGDEGGAYIVPPHRLLWHPNIQVYQSANMFFEDMQDWEYRLYSGDDFETVDDRQLDFEEYGIELRDGDNIYHFKPQMMQACERFAVLSWESSLGMTKSHTFRLTEQKVASVDDYSLDLLGGLQNAVKGRQDSITAYIDELSNYDLWYYSDILTSSNVKLLQADNYVEYTPVLVTTKNVTIPTGDKANGKIEIDITVKKYDAVTM